MTYADVIAIFGLVCMTDCTARALRHLLGLCKRKRHRKAVEARVEQIRVDQEPI